MDKYDNVWSKAFKIAKKKFRVPYHIYIWRLNNFQFFLLFSGKFQYYFQYDLYQMDREIDELCVLLFYSYVNTVYMYTMIFTMLMNLVATTDMTILNDGYLAVNSNKEEV